MGRLIDLTSQRFGQLVVEAQAAPKPLRASRIAGLCSWKARWRCRCDCGRVIEAWSESLRLGLKTHCGCAKKRAKPEPRPEYSTWNQMRWRCRHHPRYAGRVSVCREWDSFDQFYADMGPRPSPGHSLDRVNNDGDYAPNNCRWATIAQQNTNKGRHSVDCVGLTCAAQLH